MAPETAYELARVFYPSTLYIQPWSAYADDTPDHIIITILPDPNKPLETKTIHHKLTVDWPKGMTQYPQGNWREADLARDWGKVCRVRDSQKGEWRFGILLGKLDYDPDNECRDGRQKVDPLRQWIVKVHTYNNNYNLYYTTYCQVEDIPLAPAILEKCENCGQNWYTCLCNHDDDDF